MSKNTQSKEVDFIARTGGSITAIEVESGRSRDAFAGPEAFGASFKPQRKLLVGRDGIAFGSFLSRPWIVGEAMIHIETRGRTNAHLHAYWNVLTSCVNPRP